MLLSSENTLIAPFIIVEYIHYSVQTSQVLKVSAFLYFKQSITASEMSQAVFDKPHNLVIPSMSGECIPGVGCNDNLVNDILLIAGKLRPLQTLKLLSG